MTRSPRPRRATWACAMSYLIAGALLAAALAPQDATAATGAAEGPLAPGLTGLGASSETIRIVALLTLLSLAPALAICMTAFTRIVIVLSMVRHGFGMPETPPNAVLVSMAIFLTAFTMQPTLTAVNEAALKPFLSGAATLDQALDRGTKPMRAFMLKEVTDRDLQAVYDISDEALPDSAEDSDLFHLTLAFMLNELRVAFRIGFVILLPFLLIDLVVTSLLLALGMLMVPPSTISLPIKILMFVLIDGWSLLLSGLAGSFR